MRDALERRRTELAAELESGQRMLADLEARRTELQQTLLRISGAMQVLTELLDGAGAEPSDAVSADPAPGSNGTAETAPQTAVSGPAFTP